MDPTAPAAVETPTLPTVEELSGFADGHVIVTPTGIPDEKIVADTDEAGNIIGWHKEPVQGVTA